MYVVFDSRFVLGLDHRYQFSANVATIPPKKIPDEELKRIYANEEPSTVVTNENPSWAWSAGGVISTVTDLAHYAEELVNGGYLSAEMQKKRLASIRETVPVMNMHHGMDGIL